MKRTNDNSRATTGTYRAKVFRPQALNWIDFLVIAAIALTFVAIAGSTMKHAKATVRIDPPTFATEVGQIADDPGLIKARIRLATGQPWG
ncbi:hypothetical protein BH11PSE3_BH11PSE3_27350 [soil metagenome]